MYPARDKAVLSTVSTHDTGKLTSKGYLMLAPSTLEIQYILPWSCDRSLISVTQSLSFNEPRLWKNQPKVTSGILIRDISTGSYESQHVNLEPPELTPVMALSIWKVGDVFKDSVKKNKGLKM